MRVPGGNAESVVDYYQPAITGMVVRDGYYTIRRGVHRRPIIGGHIYPGVKRAFSAEGIEALAKTVGDVSQNGPDRRRIG